MLLIDLFDRGRLLNPEGVCLVDRTRGDMTVSWRNAAAHTHRIASHLQEAGVGPGDPAGILSRNDSVAFLSVLGAARLDAPWVSLSPHSRPKELAALLDRTGRARSSTTSRFVNRRPRRSSTPNRSISRSRSGAVESETQMSTNGSTPPTTAR